MFGAKIGHGRLVQPNQDLIKLTGSWVESDVLFRILITVAFFLFLAPAGGL